MIMRDVNSGWFLRYTHANVASFFFLFLYFHTARGLYYSSYKTPRVLLWSIGVIILILTMAIAFLGYKCSPKWFNFNSYAEHLSNFLFCTKQLTGLTIAQYSCKSIDKTANIPYGPPNEENNNVKNTPPPGLNAGNRIQKFLIEKNLNPVFLYDNLELESVRKQILSDTNNLSGIYLILNKVTLDYYIGSASTNRLYARFSNHLIYFKGSKVVKLAVRKYKLFSFVFMVLELFPEVVTKENNKFLLDLEDFYLKSLLPNYNILTEAGSSFGYKHTELDRIKMKTNYSLERRESIGNLNRGKKLSKETIEKIRVKALLRAKRVYSEEAVQNMKKKSKSIKVYNLDGTLFNIYPSLTDAAKNLNCGIKTICRVLKTEKKILKRRFKLSLCSASVLSSVAQKKRNSTN